MKVSRAEPACSQTRAESGMPTEVFQWMGEPPQTVARIERSEIRGSRSVQIAGYRMSLCFIRAGRYAPCSFMVLYRDTRTSTPMTWVMIFWVGPGA